MLCGIDGTDTKMQLKAWKTLPVIDQMPFHLQCSMNATISHALSFHMNQRYCHLNPSEYAENTYACIAFFTFALDEATSDETASRHLL